MGRPQNPFTMLSIAKITLLPELQVRCRVSEDKVREYTEYLNSGGEFDPVHVFVDAEGRNLLADGWHRIYAHQAAEREKIPVVLHEEDPDNALKNALEFAIDKNASHGLPPSPEDKRRMVALALKADKKRSDRAIARLCRVSPTLVAKIREKGFTPNEPRKKAAPGKSNGEAAANPTSDTVSAPAERTRPQEIEPVAGVEEAQARLAASSSETSPLMERVRTLERWVREGSLDFPDIREIFSTRESVPVMVPRNVTAVSLVTEAEPISLIVTGFRVKSGVIELAVSMQNLMDAADSVMAKK